MAKKLEKITNDGHQYLDANLRYLAFSDIVISDGHLSRCTFSKNVNGLMNPKIMPELVLEEFFNRIDPFETVRIAKSGRPSSGRLWAQCVEAYRRLPSFE